MKQFCLFFLLLVFVSSCSTFDFAKRRYNDGYYIDADSKQTPSGYSSRTAKEEMPASRQIDAEEQPSLVIAAAKPATAAAEVSLAVDEKQGVSASNTESGTTLSLVYSFPAFAKIVFAGNSKKLEIFSVLSFLIGLSAILWIAVFGILGAALLAIILGIIGRARVRKHAERYKAKGLWAVGVAFGVIILVYIAIVLATTNQTELHIFN